MYESQPSVVDRLYSDFKLIIEQIDDPENPASTISLRNSTEDVFQKTLTVAIGAYFERRITDAVLDLVGKSSNNTLAPEFARIRGIEKSYHSLFNWGDNNANSFYRLFGGDFRDYMKEYVKNNDEFGRAAKAFLELGNARNEVAHTFNSVGKTTEEIYDLYRIALLFVDQIPLRFDEFAQRQRQD